jgi:acyl carrier protein
VGVVIRANEIRVVEIVSELLGVRREDVFVDCSFANDLGAGSLDMVKLVLALEEEFDCEILDEDTENLTTVQKAIEYIDKRVTQG